MLAHIATPHVAPLRARPPAWLMTLAMTCLLWLGALSPNPAKAAASATFDMAQAPGRGEAVDIDVGNPSDRGHPDERTWRKGAPGLRTVSVGGATAWVRTELINPGLAPRSGWIQVSKPFTDELDCTLAIGASTQRHRMGDHLPFKQRPIPVGDFVIPVAMPAQSTGVLVCEIRNDGALVADIKYWTPEHYRANANQRQFWRSLAYGTLLFAALAGSVIAITSQSKIAMLMIADLIPVLMGSMGMEGDGFMHIWPDLPGLNVPPYLWLLAGLVVEAQILKALLPLKVAEKNIANAVAAGAVILLATWVLGGRAGSQLGGHLGGQFVGITFAFTVAGGIALAGLSVYNWNVNAASKVLAVGMGLQFTGVLVNVVGLYGNGTLIPSSIPFHLSSLIGGVLKVIALTYAAALMYRAEQGQRERLQQAYAQTLKTALEQEHRLTATQSISPFYQLPSLRSLDKALQALSEDQLKQCTIWLLRLNRIQTLQEVLPDEALIEAVRTGQQKLEHWLYMNGMEPIAVAGEAIVCAIGDHLFAFATRHMPRPHQVQHLADFLLARQSWNGMYLAWDPMLGYGPPGAPDGPGGSIAHARTALGLCTPHKRVRAHEPLADMNKQLRQSLTLDIDGAISRNELELHYQPKIDLDGMRTDSLEALIRWRHPQRGLIPPGLFIGEAEATGTINKITMWALREAARFSRLMQPPVARIAINISAYDIAAPRFVKAVQDVLVSEGVEGGQLTLEITESIAMDNAEHAMKTLRDLREMGLSIALDDFGTGQSSLCVLKEFPLDEVKIDRTFVTDVDLHPNKQVILSNVLRMLRALELKITVEGVETQGELAWLRQHGSPIVQGYVFSKPLPREQALAWLAGQF